MACNQVFMRSQGILLNVNIILEVINSVTAWEGPAVCDGIKLPARPPQQTILYDSYKSLAQLSKMYGPSLIF